MHLAGMGLLMLVGLMLLLLVWRQADDIAVAVVPHCELNDEAFLALADQDDLVDLTTPTVPYRVVRRADPTPHTAGECSIVGTALTTTTNLVPFSGTPVPYSVSARTADTQDLIITGSTWEDPPEFTQSNSQALLRRFPQLLLGALAFLGIGSVIAHQWYGRDDA